MNIKQLKRECFDLLASRIQDYSSDIFKSHTINLHDLIQDIDFVSEKEENRIINHIYFHKHILESECNCKIEKCEFEESSNKILSITVTFL